jgi:hypothetical protein
MVLHSLLGGQRCIAGEERLSRALEVERERGKRVERFSTAFSAANAV